MAREISEMSVGDLKELSLFSQWIEKTGKLSKEAKFTLHAMLQDRWTWQGLELHGKDELRGLLATIDEVFEYVDWSYQHLRYSDVALSFLRNQLSRYKGVIEWALENVEDGPMTFLNI